MRRLTFSVDVVAETDGDEELSLPIREAIHQLSHGAQYVGKMYSTSTKQGGTVVATYAAFSQVGP